MHDEDLDVRLARLEQKIDRVVTFTEELRGVFAAYVKFGGNKLVAGIARRVSHRDAKEQ